jgi:hypothetical protein
MDWPLTLIPRDCSIALRKSGVQFRSPFSGTVQAVRFLGERWVMSLTLPPRSLSKAGEAEALLSYLAGGVNQINCWHFGRAVPRGTMRGSPLIKTAATAGAQQLVLKSAGAFSTLLAGDMIKAGNQLHQVVADATADGTGDMTVLLSNYVRAAISQDSAVSWDKPKVPFICTSMINTVTLRPRMQDAAAIDLEEV